MKSGRQSYQVRLAALDARQKQQLAQRGLTSGTAQQQQQARMQEMQQRGAKDLIDQGIKIAGIGDQYQAAAIRAARAGHSPKSGEPLLLRVGLSAADFVNGFGVMRDAYTLKRAERTGL